MDSISIISIIIVVIIIIFVCLHLGILMGSGYVLLGLKCP